MTSNASEDQQAPKPPVQLLFEQGVQRYRQRDWAGAVDQLQKVLQINPRNANALHLLGAATAYLGNLPRAIELIRSAIALAPNSAEFHSGLANCYRAGGQNDSAVASFQRSLALSPANPSASAGLGPILVERGLVRQAIELYRHALARDPTNAVLHYFLAAAYRVTGEIEKEIESQREAVRFNSRFIEAHRDLATALRRTGAFEESSTLFGHVAALCPNSAPDVCNYALSLFSLERLTEASGFFALATGLDPHVSTPLLEEMLEALGLGIEHDPANVDILNKSGLLYRMLGRKEDCIAHFRRAIELSPGDVAVLNNFGTVLTGERRFDEAKRVLEQALEADPASAYTHNHMGNLYATQNDHERAVECFRRALKYNPDLPGGRWNLARSLLACGQFAEGWEEFDSRLSTPFLNLGSGLPEPHWDGSLALDKTILLTTEGGAGDAINFIRHVPFLRSRVGRFILRCPRELVNLFRSVPGIDQIVPVGKELPPYDKQIPLQGLPRIAKVRLENIPADVPYLFPDKGRVAYWADRLRDIKGLKVGLAWCGSLHVDADQRSQSIRVFAPLAGIEGVRFISLQISRDRGDSAPEGLSVLNYTSDLHDFAESAALVQNLDLVISVDTSTVHLAGALGCPVWVLIPYNFDFRWLADRTDSPWYPSMRLFRQRALPDWSQPINQIAEALRTLVRKREEARPA